ncbi:MAG: LysR family transcriptional regulator [Janthinobacterium lividum]|uniref:LysR family transcriptional regulator n=1 Tax=Pseudomonas TaxID=286 RepID=UPI001CFA6AB9|nr:MULTISPECIES: LysR family transcriptional regulator [Pseudomonas]
MITLAQLRCFLAVVDEMNFRRAAARLNMTQPPLTRQIQALEHQVGAPLFDRSSRHIRLTAAGEHFVRSARRIMAQSLDAVRDARRIAGGDSGALTIAFTAASSYVFLPRMVALLRAQMPEVSLTLREMTSPQQWAALRDEQIDIGLSRPPMIQAGIDSQRVYRERLCAVLPVGHALAEAGAIALEALAGETLITYPPVEALYLHDLINGWLHVRGVTFADVQHVTQTHSILALVAAGLGVGIVPQSVERFMPAEVVLKPIVGAEEVSVDLILAWRRTTDNAACQPAARLIIETLVGP